MGLHCLPLSNKKNTGLKKVWVIYSYYIIVVNIVVMIMTTITINHFIFHPKNTTIMCEERGNSDLRLRGALPLALCDGCP